MQQWPAHCCGTFIWYPKATHGVQRSVPPPFPNLASSRTSHRFPEWHNFLNCGCAILLKVVACADRSKILKTTDYLVYYLLYHWPTGPTLVLKRLSVGVSVIYFLELCCKMLHTYNFFLLWSHPLHHACLYEEGRSLTLLSHFPPVGAKALKKTNFLAEFCDECYTLHLYTKRNQIQQKIRKKKYVSKWRPNNPIFVSRLFDFG